METDKQQMMEQMLAMVQMRRAQLDLVAMAMDVESKGLAMGVQAMDALGHGDPMVTGVFAVLYERLMIESDQAA